MIRTDRLELVPGTEAAVRGALEGREALGASLNASVAEGWPPEFLDSDALEWLLSRMEEIEQDPRWWFYFIVLRRHEERIVIGSCGYKGPPVDGAVEIGYGIVSEHHRKGYGSEAAMALVRRAFEDPAVTRVIAETFPELAGSIGVLRRCGFVHVGDGSEPGALLFEVTRRLTTVD